MPRFRVEGVVGISVRAETMDQALAFGCAVMSDLVSDDSFDTIVVANESLLGEGGEWLSAGAEDEDVRVDPEDDEEVVG
jgi:hypothetical protein